MARPKRTEVTLEQLMELLTELTEQQKQLQKDLSALTDNHALMKSVIEAVRDDHQTTQDLLTKMSAEHHKLYTLYTQHTSGHKANWNGVKQILNALSDKASQSTVEEVNKNVQQLQNP